MVHQGCQIFLPKVIEKHSPRFLVAIMISFVSFTLLITQVGHFHTGRKISTDRSTD